MTGRGAYPGVVIDRQQQSVLEQLGGVSGLIYSTVPVLVFVPVNSAWGLKAAIAAALGVAVAVLVWRLYRREPVQPAVSGFLGVAVCAFIAYRTGDAKGYFLFGIYSSLAYGAVFAVSILLRWPLVGVIWGFLNGHGNAWRTHPAARRGYDIATAAWVVVFVARYIVQDHLYDADQTGWLAFARIAMGWPLAALALAISVWAARRADKLVPRPEKPAEIDPAEIDTEAQ